MLYRPELRWYGQAMPFRPNIMLLPGRWAAFVVALAVLAAGADAAPSCPAEGETVQWVADYCMLQLETDDEIAVSGCIEEQSKVPFASDCAANLHYKTRMCELRIGYGTRAGSLDQCVNDPTFKGRTVAAGGVDAHPRR